MSGELEFTEEAEALQAAFFEHYVGERHEKIDRALRAAAAKGIEWALANRDYSGIERERQFKAKVAELRRP